MLAWVTGGHCVSNDAIIWSDDDKAGEISGSRLHYLEAGARLSQGEVHWSRARWWHQWR